MTANEAWEIDVLKQARDIARAHGKKTLGWLITGLMEDITFGAATEKDKEANEGKPRLILGGVHP